MRTHRYSLLPFQVLVFFLWCTGITDPLWAATGSRSIRLATTTSMEQSGLLEMLLPPFTRKTGIKVNVIAVGSGAALELAARGDCDIVISHAPAMEATFVAKHAGSLQIPFMYSDFVVVGPPEDPAEVSLAAGAQEAFRRIAERKALFVSRGDSSGTHQKEKELWSLVKSAAVGPWYLESGQGMAETLRIADQRAAYTLSDRATFLVLSNSLPRLRILFQGDQALRNQYSIILLPTSSDAAKALADFLAGPEAAELMRSFRAGGEQVFFPSRT